MYVRSVSCVFERTGQEHHRAGSLIRQIVAYDLPMQSCLFVEHARGSSKDSSDEDMASYDGDIDCRSDEDEDDGRSPVYATRVSAHGVKQPTLTGDDIAEIYPIMRLRLTSLSQLLH